MVGKGELVEGLTALKVRGSRLAVAAADTAACGRLKPKLNNRTTPVPGPYDAR